jgi:hypothetical protein
MSDFQSGKASGIFVIGTKIEHLAESYEREAKDLEAMKKAFLMSGRTLETYRESMLHELNTAKIPIKEAEYGKTYINRCIDLVKQLYNDCEMKRLQAVGASEGVKQAVASIKRLFDEEKEKELLQRQYEEQPQKNPIERPIGAHPGEPEELSVAKTRQRKKVTSGKNA